MVATGPPARLRGLVHQQASRALPLRVAGNPNPYPYPYPNPNQVVLAPYLLGATEAAREIYSSWAGDLSSAQGDRFAEASRQEDARRTTTFFFAGNLLLADKVG